MSQKKTKNESQTGRPGGQDPQVQKQPEPPYQRQKIEKPGRETDMAQKPEWQAPLYKPAGKLEGKVALITGGDSGIGRAVAVLYGREGADVAINYLAAEQKDAELVKQEVEKEGRRCILLPADLGTRQACEQIVEKTVKELGHLDILVSNAAHQNRKSSVEEITDEEWDKTLKVNIYAYFWLVRAAMPHLKEGSSIIATGSQVAVQGSAELLDYGATKGAIHIFTKSLAKNLIKKGIRCNVVAPGPVWTPLNPADKGMDEENLSKFGQKQPIGRVAQPEEIAPAYVFLASDADSSYVTGTILEEMGGM